MADRSHPEQVQVHPHQHPHKYDPMLKAQLPGPSKRKLLAFFTLIPTSGTLLALSSVYQLLSVIGISIADPDFVICSPIIIPATMTTMTVLGGLLISWSLGLIGLSSLWWAFKFCFIMSNLYFHTVKTIMIGLLQIVSIFGVPTCVLFNTVFLVVVATSIHFLFGIVTLGAFILSPKCCGPFGHANEVEPQKAEEVKMPMQELIVEMGQKPKEVGQAMTKKTQADK